MAINEIFSGLGSPGFVTSGLVSDQLLVIEPMEFSIEGAADKKKSKKYRNGKLVTAGSALGQEEYTLKIGIEANTFYTMAFVFGELPSVTASALLPKTKFATIPSSTPYEIVDSEIGDGNGYCTFIANHKPLTKVGTAPAATGEFQIVPTSTKKLVFHSSDAGKDVVYQINKSHTSADSIGVEAGATLFDTFSFSGEIYAGTVPVAKIVIPSAVRTSIGTINVADVTKFEVEAELLVTGSDNRPFRLYDL